MKGISRRSFVAGALVLGGTAALAGCTTPGDGGSDASDSGAFDATYDVVVLGGRLAGLGAAGAAAEGGLNVVLVEKARVLSLSASTSPQRLAIAQLPENQADWVLDSPTPDTREAFEKRWADMTNIGKVDAPYPDFERMLNIEMETCKTVNWLVGMGCPFEQVGDITDGPTDGVGAVDPSGGGLSGAQMMGNTIEALLNEKGAPIMLETAGVELVFENNKVTGVIVEGPDGRQTFGAKAVVLATGGFGSSPEYREKLIPGIEALGSRSVAMPENTGDGITMATAVGAAMYDDAWVIAKALVVTDELLAADAKLDDLKAPNTCMFVDRNGKRFINEAYGETASASLPAASDSTKGDMEEQALAAAMVDTDQGPYYVLFDGSDAEATALIELGLSTKDAFKADTIEELATAAGMSDLAATFTAYQEAAASGNDAEFNKPASKMIPYAASGPYYLVHFVPSYCATQGGVLTNDSYQVLDESDAAIEGLYAVGEITHRFMYNRAYIPWASNGSGLTMGRLLGEQLAKEL